MNTHVVEAVLPGRPHVTLSDALEDWKPGGTDPDRLEEDEGDGAPVQERVMALRERLRRAGLDRASFDVVVERACDLTRWSWCEAAPDLLVPWRRLRTRLLAPRLTDAELAMGTELGDRAARIRVVGAFVDAYPEGRETIARVLDGWDVDPADTCFDAARPAWWPGEELALRRDWELVRHGLTLMPASLERCRTAPRLEMLCVGLRELRERLSGVEQRLRTCDLPPRRRVERLEVLTRWRQRLVHALERVERVELLVRGGWLGADTLTSMLLAALWPPPGADQVARLEASLGDCVREAHVLTAALRSCTAPEVAGALTEQLTELVELWRRRRASLLRAYRSKSWPTVLWRVSGRVVENRPLDLDREAVREALNAGGLGGPGAARSAFR